MFCLRKNRFNLLHRLKSCCSFITFTSDKSQPILVAIADCSINSLSKDSKTVLNSFNHHCSSVIFISFDKSGQTVLSCCKDRAILWNLKTFIIDRVLTLKKDFDIVKVCFVPGNDLIVSAFNDNSVFLWNFKSLTSQDQFICSSKENYLNIRSLDISKDGKLLVCVGKVDWFLVWDVLLKKWVSTMKIPGSVSLVKQVNFLSQWDNNYVVSLLTGEGNILVLNLGTLELVYELQGQKVTSCVPAPHPFQMITLSLQEASLNLYDIEDQVMPPVTQETHVPLYSDLENVKEIKKKKKHLTGFKKKGDIHKDKLLVILHKFGEYPEHHRSYIWSQLLKFPHNVEAFKLVHYESLKIKSFVKEYSFLNPGVMKTFSRLMSMLACWYPIIQEVDYLQLTVFPFIKVFHKNAIMCFELLLTLLCNWCQSWFLFVPFPPFHVLCCVENVLAFYDPELVVHFAKYELLPEVFAWSLLKTSFSEVLSREHFLRLWDHIFSNPVSFYVCVVAAFSILMRSELLKCRNQQKFKAVYRKTIGASVLIEKAYELHQKSPPNMDPGVVAGPFALLPSSATYPTFSSMSCIQADLQTLTRKKLLDKEIDFLKQRERNLEIRDSYLKELQELQMQRRKLLLQKMELKSIDALEKLGKKLTALQNLIQDNLSNQGELYKVTVGHSLMASDTAENVNKPFSFSDYLKKLKR